MPPARAPGAPGLRPWGNPVGRRLYVCPARAAWPATPGRLVGAAPSRPAHEDPPARGALQATSGGRPIPRTPRRTGVVFRARSAASALAQALGQPRRAAPVGLPPRAERPHRRPVGWGRRPAMVTGAMQGDQPASPAATPPGLAHESAHARWTSPATPETPPAPPRAGQRTRPTRARAPRASGIPGGPTPADGGRCPPRGTPATFGSPATSPRRHRPCPAPGPPATPPRPHCASGRCPVGRRLRLPRRRHMDAAYARGSRGQHTWWDPARRRARLPRYPQPGASPNRALSPAPAPTVP